MLAFGIGATFVTAAVCALWPVLVVSRMDTLSVLAHGASVASDPRGRWVQRAIVVGQVAVAVALLFGTTLFLRTVQGLDQTVLGFEPDHLLTLEVSAPTEDVVRWNAVMARIVEHVETVPGVRSAAVALVRPLTGPIGWDNQPLFPGQSPDRSVDMGAQSARQLRDRDAALLRDDGHAAGARPAVH